MTHDVTRRGFLYTTAGLLAAGLAQRALGADPAPAPAAGAAAAEPAKPAWFTDPLKTTRIDDGLFMLAGAGGNNVVYTQGDRLLVVDSGVPHRGADLLAAAAGLATGATIKTLFNTHYHFDHAGGNPAFAAAGYTIIGSGACRDRLSQKITVEDMALTFEPTPELSRPGVTFDNKLMVYAPAAVAITKIASAHTDTDAIAYFEKFNVLHTGDLLFAGMFPVIDRATGGSLDGMIAATKTLLTIGDGKTRVVPGHGPLSDKSALQGQLDLLNQVRERLAPLGEKKSTMDEVVAAKPLADLDAKWGTGFLQSPVFTRMAYGQWIQR